MKKENLKQKQERTKYSPEFKDRAIELAKTIGVPQAAKDLGIPPSMLYAWRKARELSGTAVENKKMQEAEMARLRRENARLAEENSFLKKAAAYFAKDPK